MNPFKMIRNTTILQRVMIVATIFWIIWVLDVTMRRSFQPRMLFLIVIVWGGYWIISGIKDWYQKK